LTKVHPRGSQILYRFPNGYGASIIPGHHDDERDVAVIRWGAGGREGWDFDWSTSIAKFALRVSIHYVSDMLKEIHDLPAKES
jgi:hypothetical protein